MWWKSKGDNCSSQLVEEMVPWVSLVSRSVPTSHNVVDKSRLPGRPQHEVALRTCSRSMFRHCRSMSNGLDSGCRASCCELKVISHTMPIKNCEECYDSWGWGSRLATQARFSAATYSREWLSMCTDRQQLHPGLVQDGFRVVGSAEKHSSVSISGPQLRRRHHRAAP